MPELETREAIDDTGSLREHEAEWSGRRVPEPARAEPPAVAVSPTTEADKEAAEQARAEASNPGLKYEPKERGRAKKNAAQAEDVPRIRELTGKVKDLQRIVDEYKAKDTPAPVVPVPAVVAPKAETTVTAFTEPEPKLEDCASADDPYATWQRKLASYDRRKDAFDEKQAADRLATETRTTQAQRAQDAAKQQTLDAYFVKRDAYVLAHPDRASTFSPETLNAMPGNPLMEAVLLQSEPDLVYTLQRRPDLLAEFFLSTDAKPVSPQYVAVATAWLHARTQAGGTAAAERVSQKLPPKPPTAVRTGPMTTGTQPPGDGASLADHEAYFTKKRR